MKWFGVRELSRNLKSFVENLKKGFGGIYDGRYPSPDLSRASKFKIYTWNLVSRKRDDNSPITDTFDYILFVIADEAEEAVFLKHYTYQDKKAALHIVKEDQLKEWLLLGTNRKVVDWIYNGKVLFDRNEYLDRLKTEIREFPFYGRKLKMGMEFAKLIRRYMDGKSFFEKAIILRHTIISFIPCIIWPVWR